MAFVNTLFNTNFLEYASYVIKDRAIPHLIDGLKPVQRRILHSLLEMDDGKFHKVANVTGHCMKYHPHGDQSIYSALVVLANKELFIERQGNFGNLFTGDEPSAARYIECRVATFAREILYNPELTEYVDSYDGRNREPVTFPAKLPVLLVQGAEGIAVGMATKILPHNLIEVIEAVKSALTDQPFELYPDFPTGGLADVSEYEEGLGRVLVRAKFDTKDPKRIVIKELPFGSTTEGLITSIENASRKGKIKVAEINDYTAERVEIEIKLPRNIYANEVLDALYAFTDCEQSISANLLVIRDDRPATMTVSEVISYHAESLLAILKKELTLERGHLKDRLHARTLERIFVEERIYQLIEEQETQSGVVAAVLAGFEPFADQIKREVTNDDVDRLLKIPIRRISKYDINKAKEEMAEIEARIKQINKHLKNLTGYAVGVLDSIIKNQAANHQRKTEIISFEKTDAREAAQRNLELRYDGATGYLGFDVRGGSSLFSVSSYDRVLVVRKTGVYSVIDSPQKLFVDKGLLACILAEKEKLAHTTISVIYRDNKTKHVYLKRCTIEQYILGKSYTIVPENCTVLKLTTKTEVDALLTYKPKPRLMVLEEAFPLGNYLIKGVRARGVRLTTKEVKSAKFVKGDQGSTARGTTNPKSDRDSGAASGKVSGKASGKAGGTRKATGTGDAAGTEKGTDSRSSRSSKSGTKSGTKGNKKSTRSNSRNGSKKKNTGVTLRAQRRGWL